STTVIAKTTPSSGTPPPIQPSSRDEPPASANTENSSLYAYATTPQPDNSYRDGTTGSGDSDAAGSKLATPVSASGSGDAAEVVRCLKYSAAVGVMVDTPCH